ncbi:MAG: NrfD/PsrC family molybdoenzyme membrane anchor subunit [Bacteroidota bacterium]
MKERLFTSGRDMLNIDPVVNAWHWEIPAYLFLGGLAAGLVFFASFYYLRGKEDQMPTAVKIAPFIAPIAIVLGLIFLLLDLKHKLYFWQLYTTIRLDSPMSWGAWTLGVVMPLSVIWPLLYLDDLKKYFWNRNIVIYEIIDWLEKLINDFDFTKTIMGWFKENQKAIAWANIILSVILGVYTGILLSAFNARPLWNTAILGPLFLTSGISTAAATIMWMAYDHYEKVRFSRIDLWLIAVELFLITHMFMGLSSGTSASMDAAALFLGGPYTVVFWVGVVGMGLLFPAVLESMELLGYKVPIAIPAFFIILGGAIFRFVMVDAGQFSKYFFQ